MIKQVLLILSLLLTIQFLSCKKKNNTQAPAPTPTPAPAPANSLFVSFTLDGSPKNFTSATASMNQGYSSGSSTSSGFYVNDNISINLSMMLDSIMGSDLQGLVGQKIRIGSCGGCPTNIHMNYEIGGNLYTTSDTYNTLPNEFIRFNSVTFDKTVTSFGKQLNQYYIKGDFNVKLTYGNDTKNATNGSFGLLFRESKH